MNNRWIVKHDGEIVYQPQTIDAKILDISDEALAKISMYVNSESITISNLKLEIEDLKEQLNKVEGKCNKLKGLLLLVDDSVSHFKCGSEVQLAQWEEFIKCFPEEGEK